MQIFDYGKSYALSSLLATTNATVYSTPTLTCNGSSSCSVMAGSPVTLAWSCSSPSDTSTSGSFPTGGAKSGSAQVTPSSSTTYTIQCNPSGSYASVPVTVLNPQLNLSISPELVKLGQSLTVQWSAQNVQSCTVTGPGVNTSGLSGSVSTPIYGRSLYTLTCKNPTSSISISKEALLVPTEKEQ